MLCIEQVSISGDSDSAHHIFHLSIYMQARRALGWQRGGKHWCKHRQSICCPEKICQWWDQWNDLCCETGRGPFEARYFQKLYCLILQHVLWPFCDITCLCCNLFPLILNLDNSNNRWCFHVPRQLRIWGKSFENNYISRTDKWMEAAGGMQQWPTFVVIWIEWI